MRPLFDIGLDAQPPEVATPAQQDIPALIEAELVLALYQRTPQILGSNLLTSGLLAWVLRHGAHGSMVAAWLALTWLMLGLRTLDWRAYMHQPQRRAHTQHWRRRHALGSTASGLSWGIAGVLFLPTGDAQLDGLLIAGLVGVASVGVFNLSGHIGDALRYMAGALVPTTLHYLWLRNDVTTWFLALGVPIYLAVMWREGLRARSHMVAALRLRFENAAIATSREKAWREAQESSQAKSRFLALVSHELRTPLNGILGMAQLLAHAHLPQDQHDRVQVIDRSARHLLALINDLLDVSRVEIGRLNLNPQPTDPAQLAREVVDLLRPVAESRHLALRLHLAPALPALALLDAARVRQVLVNLLGNALKFTQQGQIELQLACDAPHLVYVVSDTGPGIAPEQRERIFMAFEQGGDHAATAGAGLGLTISRQLARAMGGELGLDAGTAVGASFRFTLPLQVVAPSEAVAAPAPAATPQRMTGRVLVVEDNPVNALVTTGMLGLLGLASQVAENGEQALAMLARDGADLMLLDCQMPVLDGWETSRRWRAHEAQAGRPQPLPIIALTANATDTDRQRCLAAGMDGLLAKPFTLEALAQVLARHLPSPAAAGPAPDNPPPCESTAVTTSPPTPPAVR